MASRSASRAFGLLLAVIAALGFVITASNRTGSATAARHPGTPGNGATPARRPGAEPGSPVHSHAVPGVAEPRPSASRARIGMAPRKETRDIRPPATPTDVTIESPQGKAILSAPVDPITAHRNSDGTWAPVSPPSLTRAVWMTQSAMPAAPSTGTTAIYGHACIGFTCSFNNVANTPPNSTVIVKTRTAVLRYRVVSLIQYPKAGSQSLGSRRDIADQLLLITCAYHPDGSSTNNLVLVASLVGP